MSKNNVSWDKIYNDLQIKNHDFNKYPFIITAEQIKVCVKDFNKTSEKEVRVLCKQDSRERASLKFLLIIIFLFCL